MAPIGTHHPALAAETGARIDAFADVRPEDNENLFKDEEECRGVGDERVLSECSWIRQWRRRFRVFNIGTQNPDPETGGSRPATVAKPVYGCDSVPYDECVINAGELRFSPGE